MRTRAWRFRLGLAAVVALSGAACESAKESVSASSVYGDWLLTLIGGPRGEDLAAGGGKPPSLHIAEDGRVSGFSGVNRFAGTTEIAALREGKLALTPLAVTRMAGPPAAMDLENRFLTALEQARSFRIDGDALRLAAVDGKDLLTFQRSP